MPHQRLPLTRWLMQFDYLLLLFVILATGFGMLVLDGGTHDVQNMGQYVPAQMRWWSISAGIFAAALLFPYRWLHGAGWPLYLLCLILLALLLAAARHWIGFLETVQAGGANSWFEVRIGGAVIRFQPSEFAKITTVIVLAHWLAWRRTHLHRLHEAIVPLLLALVPMALVFLQPDFGTAAVFLPLPLILLFVAGIPWRIVLAGVGVTLVLALGAGLYLAQAESVPGLRAYQLKRIRVFLDPLSSPFKIPGVEELLHGRPEEAAAAETVEEKAGRRKNAAAEWNIRQAEMALGSGRIWGKGWRQGTQSRYRFLPQHHTDFIFSALGEQFGLAGCLALLGLYLLIVWRAVHIAVAATDPFGKYLVIGLLGIVLVHIGMNIGMSIRLLPVTGVPLPLISYGGSFLATNYLIFGLIANVGMRRRPAEDDA